VKFGRTEELKIEIMNKKSHFSKYYIGTSVN
jgi:hypothetical protein